MKWIPSLHTISEYSFMESSIKIDDLILFAKKHELTSLAITDHNNMFGVAKFIYECKKNNIKPIIGVDLDVEDFRLILIAKNYQGYLHISYLVSQKNYGQNINRTDIDDQNIFIIDHPKWGFFKKEGEQLSFNNYFVCSDPTLENSIFVKYTRCLSQQDYKSLTIIDSLKKGNKVNDVTSGEYILINENENIQTKRIINIINQIEIEFPKNVNPIPIFNKSQDSKKLFIKIIKENIFKNLKKDFNNKNYQIRLKTEIAIIQKLNFEDYFLIIWDLVKWTKSKNILVGPGRGSVAGSLVAYVLGITEIDPLKYDLLFERFLNPERISMPDIDIDIEDEKREVVINYLCDKYGKENVGLISTFQTLGAKSSLRDIGRLMNISNSEVISLTKLIPKNLSLIEAFQNSFKFKAAINKNENYIQLFNNALKIEGLPRQVGTHAAGVVISNNKLIEKTPIIKSSEGYTQVQLSMEYLEDYGLLKFDILGLRNLTILKDIQYEIYKNHKRSVLFTKIPLQDKKTNELLSLGKTIGIFQLESYGMKNTIMKVGVESVFDLSAIISLFRPGPMDFIQEYALVKNKKKQIKKVDFFYDEIVKNTNGIIVYQEQIMAIAQKYASMTFGKADILRRAISKKNNILLKSLRQEFIEGSINNNHSQIQSERIYSLIEKFANYGFNKSHAIAYGTLSYRIAYLKAWFPFEFYTSLMKHNTSSPSILQQYISEAKWKKIQIIAPEVNLSELQVINKKPKIILPLNIIKGLGTIVNQKIIEERQKGKFLDFFNFVTRMIFIGIGENIIISLIKAQALRNFGNSSSLLDSLPHALRYSNMVIANKDDKKIIDFSLLKKPQLIISPQNINIDIKNEFSVLGFNLSLFKSFSFESKYKLIDLENQKNIQCVVVLKKIRKIKDKNGNYIGLATLCDSTATIEAWVFDQTLEIIKNVPLETVIKTSLKNNNNKFIIEKVWKAING